MANLVWGRPLAVDPDILESRERERWVEVLSTYIVEAGLPVVTLIEGSADRRQAWRRVFGARRAKTLRNRARAFKRYRTWLETVRGRTWPARVSDVTDFLEERAKDGCGFSVPGLQPSRCLSLWGVFPRKTGFLRMRQ